jgi:hypothetical protein
MRRQLNEIRPKLLQPWEWSPYGEAAGQSGSIFYNTTWSLLRYAIDRFGTSDASFMTALTNSTQTGIANILSVAGTTIDQLIGGWGLALVADDYPGMPTTNNVAQFQTWNLRSIYAGLNASPTWSGSYPTPFPIKPTLVNFGSFDTDNVSIRGGAHAFYEISGNATSEQMLRIRSASGGPVSPDVRLAIVRLQ